MLRVWKRSPSPDTQTKRRELTASLSSESKKSETERNIDEAINELRLSGVYVSNITSLGVYSDDVNDTNIIDLNKVKENDKAKSHSNSDYTSKKADKNCEVGVDIIKNTKDNLLTERSSLINSITWLERHVPKCVMSDLREEVIRIHNNEKSMLKMPYAQTYSAALLFVDMSGFTQLCLLLDLESLSRVRTQHAFNEELKTFLYFSFKLLIYLYLLNCMMMICLNMKISPSIHIFKKLLMIS